MKDRYDDISVKTMVFGCEYCLQRTQVRIYHFCLFHQFLPSLNSAQETQREASSSSSPSQYFAGRRDKMAVDFHDVQPPVGPEIVFRYDASRR